MLRSQQYVHREKELSFLFVLASTLQNFHASALPLNCIIPSSIHSI